MTKILKRILTALFWGGMLTTLGFILRFSKGGTLQNFCDAFSLTGVTLLGVAGVGYLRRQDFFSGVGYALQQVKISLFPFLNGKRESYSEYRKRKEEERTDGEVSVLPCVIAGLFYLAIACVLLLAIAFLR